MQLTYVPKSKALYKKRIAHLMPDLETEPKYPTNTEA